MLIIIGVPAVECALEKQLGETVYYFETAYDSVRRSELWQLIAEHGFPANSIMLMCTTLMNQNQIFGSQMPQAGSSQVADNMVILKDS